ncbi:glycosyltransferase family 4 protein [Melanomma pulvis-pyrius CBS 109.77]|uniref:Glycosyltransferase family 4 protein n=1 Tax=Melanomma pulvis-pyrius CBS 109.77 TaxID=1314802 RepID=A0A6A6WUN0_9PLEO|nr:glycosyltransferase family 4 protein [Melanomma pulvis-pyrius CBS 109.77]
MSSPTSSRPALLRKATRESFNAGTSINQMKKHNEEGYGVGLQSLYIGIAVAEGTNGELDVGFSSHDGTYSIDFAVTTLEKQNWANGTENSAAQGRSVAIADFLIKQIRGYMERHLYKFVGAGLTKSVVELSPELPSRLWLELDIVPLVLEASPSQYRLRKAHAQSTTVDEEADSMARKCLLNFGPNHQPRVCVGYRNQVEVDCEGHAQISNIHDFRGTVRDTTWQATMKFAESLKKNNTSIAFFNSTPQGGGVALMRHALIRFLRLVGVNASWYVPKPKPEVFRITKNNHNILQGVADPELRLTDKQMGTLDEWCKSNADRFWIPGDGALAPRSRGGADVIIIDDPQMPSLVKIAKEQDPTRPVIFRSHIQVRADLADQQGTPTSEVWNWVQNNVEKADVFISHPVREFVPSNIDFNKVGYMPATTDWLDGLNKHLNNWNTEFYINEFDTECYKKRMNQLQYLERQYIVQIARFDPAKGIPDVLASYAELRRKYMKDTPIKDIPQLVIAGHGAIDDPDATTIYDETIDLLKTKYSDVQDDVVVMRLGPTDQLLNALMSTAYVALQLSTREGFEVKVSEALHKGVPIIATKAGGIPLQVEHGKSGFLVEPGDSSAVAKHLHHLFTDHEAYDEMSYYAKHHVSDEVSTVGNALCWLYLADTLAKGEKIEPNSRWINDMAREEAGVPYTETETRLPRDKKLDLNAE